MGKVEADNGNAPRALVEELLMTGLTITDLLASLLDEIPDPGTPEDGETVIARVVTTCQPALAEAPAEECLTALILLRAIRAQAVEALSRSLA